MIPFKVLEEHDIRIDRVLWKALPFEEEAFVLPKIDTKHFSSVTINSSIELFEEVGIIANDVDDELSVRNDYLIFTSKS